MNRQTDRQIDRQRPDRPADEGPWIENVDRGIHSKKDKQTDIQPDGRTEEGQTDR